VIALFEGVSQSRATARAGCLGRANGFPRRGDVNGIPEGAPSRSPPSMPVSQRCTESGLPSS